MNELYEIVYQTCKEMFEARKYEIIKESPKLELEGLKKNGKKVQLYILPDESSKLNIDVIKYYHSLLRSNKISHGILVYHNVFTSSVKKLLEHINNEKFCIELFNFNELTYNVTKHSLVPKHIKIKKESSQIDELKFYPKMLETDPIARFYNFKKEDLIKIVRLDGTLYYRVIN